MSESVPSVCFVGWNAFQLLHFLPVIAALPDACFVLEVRGSDHAQISEDLIHEMRVPVVRVAQKEIQTIDGQYDVIVCQNYFPGLEKFKKSKVAMMQYGYAKLAHNYGPWRALADLVLTYGEHASRAIKPFAPTKAVGVPKYDLWLSAEWQSAALRKFQPLLDESRKTVVYAPTWGELTSIDRYLDTVVDLASNYNLIIKAHHLRPLSGLDPSIVVLGAKDDLFEALSVADVFISDYSGAIFDALLCNKPIALLDLPTADLKGDKSDHFSLEISRRNEIGRRVESPEALLAVVKKLLAERVESSSLRAFRDELFMDQPGAAERAVAAIHGLAANEVVLTQTQRYVRAEVKARLAAQISLKAEKAKFHNANKRLRATKNQMDDLKQRAIVLPKSMRWLQRIPILRPDR